MANRLKDTAHILKQNFENIVIGEHGKVFKITLNRPKKLNALDNPTVKELLSLVPVLPNYHAIWLDGAGGKAFCAGGDIKSQIQPGATD